MEEEHVDPASAPGRPRSAGPWLLRVAAGFVLVLVLLTLGLGGGTADGHRIVSSAAQQAQLDAEGRFRTLAEQARAATGTDPALAARLAPLAADLDVQAAAVALPRPPGGGTAPALSVPPLTPAATPGSAADLLPALRESALRSLRDAVTADPGPGRVLAAAGANQWRHAVLLGEALGVEPGLPSPDATVTAAVTAGEPAVGQEPGQAEGQEPGQAGACAGTPLGPEADRVALQSARSAEEQAGYGYEVAAGLLDDPAPALVRARLHADLAAAAAARLAELCVTVPPAPLAYTIDAAFRADPVAALRDVDQERAELYAGLLPTVGPGGRAWIVASFNAAAQRSLAAGTPLDALPGLVVDAP